VIDDPIAEELRAYDNTGSHARDSQETARPAKARPTTRPPQKAGHSSRPASMCAPWTHQSAAYCREKWL